MHLLNFKKNFLIFMVLLMAPSLIQAKEFNISISAINDAKLFSYEVDPGEIIKDKIRLKNNSSEDQLLELHIVDANINENGSAYLKGVDDAQKIVGTWGEIGIENPIPVKTGEQLDIPFTLQVPKDLAPGSYEGGFVIQGAAAESNEANKASIDENGKKKTQATIAVLSRIGVRINIQVKGEVKFNLSWEEMNHEKIDGKIVFHYKIANTGNANAMLKGALTLKPWFEQEKTIDLQLSNPWPGTSIQPQYILENPPPFGRIKASSTIEYQRIDVFNKPIKENEKDEGKWEKSLTIWLIPIKEMVASLMIFAIAFAVLQYKGKRFQAMLKSWSQYRVKENENLMSIAQMQKIDWKFLAKMNKIKAPYILTPGQTLLVPAPIQNTNSQIPNTSPLFPNLINASQPTPTPNQEIQNPPAAPAA